MFQAGGLVVVLVEVSRKAYLASIVPVIVNSILNEHQIIVDIVAFVNRGDFPRSRLNEKQRGKILAGWVSRKMRTMAQFAIKDMDADLSGPTGQPDAAGGMAGEPGRTSLNSLRSPMGPGASSSLRNMEPAPQILEQRELEDMHGGHPGPTPTQSQGYYPYQRPDSMGGPGPAHVPMIGNAVEMPAEDNERIFGVPDAPARDLDPEATPTKSAANRISVAPPPHGFDLPDFGSFGDESPPPVGAKPLGASGLPQVPAQRMLPSQQRHSQVYDPAQGQSQPPPQQYQQQHHQQQQPVIRLPGVDGRESMDWSPGPGQGDGEPTEEDWTRDAIMHMNLAGDLKRREG